MKKKKLLIIAYSYPPSNAPAAQRPYALAKYLDKEKFDVKVITCGNADSSLGFDINFDETIDDVTLLKINSFLGHKASAFRDGKMAKKRSFSNRVKSFLFSFFSSMVIPDKGIFWYPNVIRYLKNNRNILEETEIIFTTSPAFTNHLIGNFVKKKIPKIKWIAELRDFHAIEKNTNSVKNRINKFLENLILKNSDQISFISNSMRDIYASYYKKYSSKFNVVYNGFDLSEFSDFNVGQTQNKKLTIFYAGSFYGGVRSPIPLLQIIEKLLETKKMTIDEIEISIAGNLEAKLIEEAKNYKSYQGINFIGKIPRAKVLAHLVKSDLLWLIVGNKPTHYTGVPIKFFEYLAARRPIINFAPDTSEPTSIIEKYHLGWSVNTAPFDINKGIEVFDEIFQKYRSGDLSNSLVQQEIPDFDRKFQAEKFSKIFL